MILRLIWKIVVVLPLIAHSIDVRLLRDAAGRPIGVIYSPVRKQSAKVNALARATLGLSLLGRV